MENWEKRFDEKFCFMMWDKPTLYTNRDQTDDMKEFISSELELAKQEERERIKKEVISLRKNAVIIPFQDACDRVLDFIHQNNNEQGGK